MSFILRKIREFKGKAKRSSMVRALALLKDGDQEQRL
jgi:hypothetical protein